MFDNLKTDDTIEKSTDVIGGFGVIETNCYNFTIELAYIDYAVKTNAMSMTVHLKGPNGEQLRNTQWVASGDKKGNKNYYIDQKTQTKRYLPGFTLMNDVALLSIGKELSQLNFEDKVLKLYDFKEGKDVPSTKKVAIDLIGSQITLGVVKQTVDKTKLNETTGDYDPTGETREENDIDKAFRTSDSMTTVEILAESTESMFKQKWLDKNMGVTRNKAKGITESNGVTSQTMPGSVVQAGANGASPSLFAQN